MGGGDEEEKKLAARLATVRRWRAFTRGLNSSRFVTLSPPSNVTGHVCSRSAQKYVNQRHEIDTLRRVDDHQPRGGYRAASRHAAKHQKIKRSRRV